VRNLLGLKSGAKKFTPQSNVTRVNTSAPRSEQMETAFHTVVELAMAVYLERRCKSVPQFVNEAKVNAQSVFEQIAGAGDEIVSDLLLRFMMSKTVVNAPARALARIQTPLRHILFGHDVVNNDVVTGSVPAKELTKADINALNSSASAFFTADDQRLLNGLFAGRNLDSSFSGRRFSQQEVYFMLVCCLLMLSGRIVDAFRHSDEAVQNPRALATEDERTALATELPPPPSPAPVAGAHRIVQTRPPPQFPVVDIHRAPLPPPLANSKTYLSTGYTPDNSGRTAATNSSGRSSGSLPYAGESRKGENQYVSIPVGPDLDPAISPNSTNPNRYAPAPQNSFKSSY
jgi:hypothetical protein